MNLEEYTKEKLWEIIVETAHSNAMYPTHKAYTRDSIMKIKSEITPDEVVSRLNTSFGEALVILQELNSETKKEAKV